MRQLPTTLSSSGTCQSHHCFSRIIAYCYFPQLPHTTHCPFLNQSDPVNVKTQLCQFFFSMNSNDLLFFKIHSNVLRWPQMSCLLHILQVLILMGLCQLCLTFLYMEQDKTISSQNLHMSYSVLLEGLFVDYVMNCYLPKQEQQIKTPSFLLALCTIHSHRICHPPC